MLWWYYALGIGIGLLIGWIAGISYKKSDPNRVSKIVMNLLLGAVGGFVGGILFWLMQKLAVAQVLGVIIMSSVGAILLLWLLAKVKKTDSGK